MRTPRGATRMLAAVMLLGVIADVAARPSPPPPALIAARPPRLRRIAPPRCGATGLGDLILLSLREQDLHPGYANTSHGGVRLSVRDDGSYEVTVGDYQRVESGCASSDAILALAAQVDRLVPPRSWRDVAGAAPLAWWQAGAAPRLTRVTRMTRAGARVADVDATGLREAFLEASPSYERQVMRRLAAEPEVAAASFTWETMICGHCGGWAVRAIVRRDGWFTFERGRGYEVPDTEAGRFDPDDALAFYDWLRARDALHVRGGGWVEQRLQEQHRTGCPMRQAWIEAIGFDLAALGSGEDRPCETTAGDTPFTELE